MDDLQRVEEWLQDYPLTKDRRMSQLPRGAASGGINFNGVDQSWVAQLLGLKVPEYLYEDGTTGNRWNKTIVASFKAIALTEADRDIIIMAASNGKRHVRAVNIGPEGNHWYAIYA